MMDTRFPTRKSQARPSDGRAGLAYVIHCGATSFGTLLLVVKAEIHHHSSHNPDIPLLPTGRRARRMGQRLSPLYATAKIATEAKSTAVAAGMNQLEEGS